MDLFNIKGLVVVAILSGLGGTFGGGFIVHKFWLGAAAQSKVKSLEQDLESTKRSAELSKQGRDQAEHINEILRKSFETSQTAVSSLSEQNVNLALSRAPRIEKHFREVEKRIEDIKDLDACAAAPIDERLLNIVWPDSAKS